SFIGMPAVPVPYPQKKPEALSGHLHKKTKKAKILIITKDFGFLILRFYLLCFLKGKFLWQKPNSFRLCVSMDFLSGQQRAVAGKFTAAGNRELPQQVIYCEFFLFFPADIQNNLSIVHHNQTIAVSNGVFHVMGN